MSTPDELKVAIATYEHLIGNYEGARERLLDRRRLAINGAVTVLNDHLAANQRTIDTLRRAVEFSREQLKTVGCESPTAEFRPPTVARP